MRLLAPAQQRVHESLTTSALPKEQDFAVMAALGFEFVLNLGHPDDTLSLEEEDRLVVSAGMRYLHLPVSFKHPDFADYELLRDLLRTLYPRKVWLHCTKNQRTSALIFLHEIIDRSVPLAEARARLHRIWQPDEVWQAFLDEALEKYIYQYL